MARRALLLIITLLAIATISSVGLVLYIKPAPLSLSKVKVQIGDIEDAVTAVGTLQPTQYVDVGAQVSGQVQNIFVTIGDKVKKGQLLAQIDPTIQISTVEADQAQLDSQRAGIKQQQAQLNLAKLEDNRQQQMLAEGSTSMQEAQASAANKQIALAQLESSRAQLLQIISTIKGDRAKLGYTKIYAPIDGIVVSMSAIVGQTLNATQQTPLIMRIADLNHMTVSVRVSEADIPRLRVGMPLYFNTLGYPDDRWHAKLDKIIPMPMSDIGSNGTTGGGSTSPGGAVFYTATFSIDNSDGRLMPQMTAQVFLLTQTAHDVPTLPLAALTLLANGDYQARVAEPGTSNYSMGIARTVKIGARGPVMFQITSGLALGEEVFLPPAENSEITIQSPR